NLDQGAPQSLKIVAPLPPGYRANLGAIKIDQPDMAGWINENIMGIQVGVPYPCFVHGMDSLADGACHRRRRQRAPPIDVTGQGLHVSESLDQNGCLIGQAVAPPRGSQGTRHPASLDRKSVV